MKSVQSLKNLPAPVAASIAFFAVSAVQKGIAFLASPIYTRVMSQSEYGEATVFISWFGLMGVVTMFCLACGVFNNGMMDYENDRDGYSFSMLVLANVITLICFIAMTIAFPYTKPFLQISFPLFLFMFFLFFTQPAFDFWLARQRFEYKYKAMSAVVLSVSLLSPVAAVSAILLFPDAKVYARIFGGYGIFAAVYSAFYIYIAAKAKWKINASYWKEAFLFNLPLIPHYLSGYALAVSDRIMIARLIDAASAAKYGLAAQAAFAGTIAWGAINASLIPYTYGKCKADDFASVSAVTSPIIIGYAFICALLILLAPEIVTIMAPKSYRECIYIIPPIVSGAFFMSLYSIFANIVYYYKRPKYVMYASVSAASLNILLNLIFIPRYGYAAAAYTTLFCYLVQALLDFTAMKKVTGKSVYDIKLLVFTGVLMTLAPVPAVFLYGRPFLRYAVVLLITAAFYRKKDKFINVLRGTRNRKKAAEE